MMRLAGRPRVMAVIGEPIWVMNPICFEARAAKAVRACIVTGNNSSPRSRNIPFFQVTYSGNQVALFVGTPIWTAVGVSVWAPYGKLNRKMIAADRLIICLIGLKSYPFCWWVEEAHWSMQLTNAWILKPVVRTDPGLYRRDRKAHTDQFDSHPYLLGLCAQRSHRQCPLEPTLERKLLVQPGLFWHLLSFPLRSRSDRGLGACSCRNDSLSAL